MDPDQPDLCLVKAGPPEGDPELLLQYISVVLYALPNTVVEHLDVVETDAGLWSDRHYQRWLRSKAHV